MKTRRQIRPITVELTLTFNTVNEHGTLSGVQVTTDRPDLLKLAPGGGIYHRTLNPDADICFTNIDQLDAEASELEHQLEEIQDKLDVIHAAMKWAEENMI